MLSPHHHSRLLAAAIGGLLVLSVPPLRACGPDFPNAYLATSPENLAALPTLSFGAELDRLLPAGTTRPAPPSGDATGLTDVREALAAAGLSRREVETALTSYRRESPPPVLPREFHLYAAGARAWHAGATDEALNAWRELLALPSETRRHRTTWAAYMVGRALWDGDGELACAAFQQVRESARQGFADSEGLAVASLGWEARVHLRRGGFAEAVRLYYRQYAAGDPGALPSLQATLRQLFQGSDDREAGVTSLAAAQLEDSLREIARDRSLRGIVTAWFASRGGPHAPWSLRTTRQFRQWLGALPKSDSLAPDEADRWAWAAYQNGLWPDAEALAKLAPAEAPASEWVRAMLLLRNGDLPEATKHLAGAARAFPEDPALGSKLFLGDENRFESTHEDLPGSALSGVRGVLALRRGQYLESLRLFLHAGHWADAAYVAERVLTLDELTLFVRDEIPASAAANPTADSPWVPAAARAVTASRDLRHLLARRLARAGQFDRAREFYPADFVGTFDAYVGSVRRGYREDLPAAERAEALWQAAQLARKEGMTLQGTELEPDFTIWRGNFEWPGISAARNTDDARSSRHGWTERERPAGLAGVTVATPDEYDRVTRQRPPTKRYHYQQRAAQLAWLASTLLPDNDDRTALILNTAGRWIAPRYPEDADLFYKTLAFRCPRTALGKAAAERRWFVPPGEAPGL